MRLTLLLSFACLLWVQQVAAQTGNGVIKGRIVNPEGLPASDVHVGLKNTGYSVTTGSTGQYEFTVPEGAYILVVQGVGFDQTELPVTAKADQTINVAEVSLSENHKDVESVTVEGRVNRFADKESEQVSRMPLKNLENPQVYTVIGKELMQEQITTDYNTAFRNAPGVTPSSNPAGSVDVSMRGFSASTSVRNGMASEAWTMVDPVNIERTEIIKGPSGTLFGSSVVSFGGLVNRVTKRPMDVLKGELSYSTGSYNLNRLTVDVNAPLTKDKTVLLRLNGALHSEASFMNIGHQRSYIIAPSLSYKMNDRLTFFFDAELYRANRTQVPYYLINSSNVTFRNFKDMPLDYKTSLGGEDIDAQQTATNYFAQAVYKINKNFTSSTNFSSSNNRIDYSYQFYPTWISDDSVAREIDLYGPRSFSTIQFQQNFNHDITIGKIRNRLVAGFDINYYNRNQKVAWKDYDTVVTTQPFAPITKTQSDNLIGSAAYYYRGDQVNYSVYASIVTSVNERLLVMLSLRMDVLRYFNSYSNNENNNDEYAQTSLSPKFGLVYQLLKDRLSVFSNYMNGFVNVSPVQQPDGTISVFKPQNANQWEIGAKADLFDHKLSATVSYYDIQVTHSTRYIASTGFTVQDGTQRSKGYEVELIANPVKGLNLIAGYANNINQYIKAEEELQGKEVAGAPRETVNLWISYKLSSGALRNLGAGFGTNYVSNSYWDAENEFILPEYALLNATLFYDQPRWRLGVKANNITNQKYWSFNGSPQQLSQFIGNLTFRF